MDASTSKKRFLILGGGFGGVATACHLERLFRRRPDVEIVLVSRDNFVLIRPAVVKVGLDSETALLLREVTPGDAAGGRQEEGGGRTDSATAGSPLALSQSELRRPKPAGIERGAT